MRRPKTRQEQIIQSQRLRHGIIFGSTIVALVGIFFCGYGHAAFNTDLQISGLATVEETLGLNGYMQDLTPIICGKVAVGTTGQMIDKRDNKVYWVTKFKDGNCWMTQNLALDLSTSRTLRNSDTALTTKSSWRPSANTAASWTKPASLDANASMKSWNFGKYVLASSSPGRCGYNKTSPADCPNQAIAVGNRKPSSDPNFYANNGKKTYTATEYDAHYLIGNYYQYNAATAGTGGSFGAGNVGDSICPKGWRLPADTGTGSYRDFFNAETKLSTLLREPPYYYVQSGALEDGGLDVLGYEGDYWASTSKDTLSAYYFYIYTSAGTSTNTKRYGHTIRCTMVGQ